MNDNVSGAAAAAQRAASQVPDAWADAATRLPGSAAASSGGRVPAAVAAIDGAAGVSKRTRTEGVSGERSQDHLTDPDMVFDAGLGIFVHKDSLPDDKPVSRSGVQEMLQAFRKGLDTTMGKAAETAMQAVKQEIFEHVDALFTEYDKSVQDRFGSHGRELASQRTQLQHHEEELATLKRDMEKMRNMVGVATTAHPTRNQLAEPEFYVEADPSILKLNTDKGTQVPKTRIIELLKPWMEECQLSDSDWKVVGGELDRNFDVLFQGEGGVGGFRARKVFQTRRNREGEFRPLAVQSSTGPVQIYVKPNQNPNERKIEQDGRKIFKLLKDKFPQRTVHLARREGAVSIDLRLAVKVVPRPGDAKSELQFNLDALAALGIDKKIILDSWAHVSGAVNRINWAI